MFITEYNSSILKDLEKIHDKSFPFPNLDDPTYIIKDVAMEGGELIGCGLIRITSEFTLILDQTKPLRQRIFAMKGLEGRILEKLKKKGIRDVHVFIDDNRVTRYAERIGFERCPEKSALSLRFGY